ncbi:MAG: hypothetical protein ACHQX1_00510 [Candidatus Micrarchaeales archaeon]
MEENNADIKHIKQAQPQQKAQSLVEMLTTYSWAILIISIFIAIVFILSGNPSGVTFEASSCTIQALFPCQDTIMTNYSAASGILYYIIFINNLQNPMLFPTNAFSLTTTGIGILGTEVSTGNCWPKFALSSDAVTCIVKIGGKFSPSSGTRVSTQFTFSYNLCNNNMQSSCGPALYKSSGFAIQTIAPAQVKFYGITVVANDVNGYSGATAGTNSLIFINGAPYATNQLVVLSQSGNYNVYMGAISGFAFGKWSTNNALTVINPATSINAILTVKANATITGATTNAPCGVCYPITGTPICPATCSTLNEYTTASCSVGGAAYAVC